MDKQALILLSSINYILGVIDASKDKDPSTILECTREALEIAVDEFCDGGKDEHS